MMRLLALFILLLGADPPPAPVEPAPTVSTGPAIPAEATGDQVLQIAIEELTAGRYENALAVAIPALAKYPDLAPSFHAVIDVAADQLERQRQAAVSTTAPGSTAIPSYHPITSRRPAPGHVSGQLLWGFDLGLPTGLRVEWRFGGKVVDSMGLRVGGNLIVYDGAHAIADMSLITDFRVVEDWQLEVVTGLLTYYGWVYPQIGAAVQYDPKGPLQANLGAKVGPYASFMPDAGVAFVW
jgi:hypothetical protein